MEHTCPIPIIPMPFITGLAAVPLDGPEGVHPLRPLPLLPHPHHPVPEAGLLLCLLAGEVTGGGGEHERV